MDEKSIAACQMFAIPVAILFLAIGYAETMPPKALLSATAALPATAMRRPTAANRSAISKMSLMFLCGAGLPMVTVVSRLAASRVADVCRAIP